MCVCVCIMSFLLSRNQNSRNGGYATHSLTNDPFTKCFFPVAMTLGSASLAVLIIRVEVHPSGT